LLAGTVFQRRVWAALQRVPRGETRSYTWLAAEAGHPKAVRAAGAACGANPIPVVIPCHRILRSNGALGGFSGGLHWKRRLLALERR
jgi:O-6-methylguanine DNA methyltransferase